MKTETNEQQQEWIKLQNQVGIGLPSESSDEDGKRVVRFMDSFTRAYENHPGRGLHSAMSVAEIHFLSLDEIGQALVLLSSLWSYSDDLVSSFTPIEYKMYVEALSGMIAAQQLEAQDLTEPKKNLA